MGWFNEDLMKAWKHLFPLTPISMELGSLPLTNPAWFNWENPWWNFLSDIPSRNESNILGWRGLPSIFRELVLGNLNQPNMLLQQRMLMDQPITTSIMGNREGRKIIQIFYPIQIFSLVISQCERQMGVMEHVLILKQGMGYTKKVLKDLGWTMMEQMRALPPIDECPSPDMHLSMNIILWNFREALNPNFHQSVENIVSCHSPSMMIITETRVGGDRAKEIIDRLPFDVTKKSCCCKGTLLPPVLAYFCCLC